MRAFKIQVWVCNSDRISALLFLFLLVSSFLGWKQKIKKSHLFALGFKGVYSPPQCVILKAASRVQLKYFRLVELLILGC